jgi:hypothetical protein
MKPNKSPVIFNKKKRHFLLIEILIALALISLFSFPLLRNPIYFCISQINSLQKIECERMAELTFLEIKLSFLKKEINLKNIPREEKEALEIPLRPYYLDTLKNKEVQRSFKIYSKKEKVSKNDQVFKLVNVTILLQPKDLKKPYQYKYKIAAQR